MWHGRRFEAEKRSCLFILLFSSLLQCGGDRRSDLDSGENRRRWETNHTIVSLSFRLWQFFKCRGIITTYIIYPKIQKFSSQKIPKILKSKNWDRRLCFLSDEIQNTIHHSEIPEWIGLTVMLQETQNDTYVTN